MIASTRNQNTIAAPTRVYGFGFWSGRDVCLEFRPAPPNQGIRFIRQDLPQAPAIAASVLHRVPGPRRTTLVHHGCAVEMVEHVLAALAGLQIDNCDVWIDRPEVPGCDGSSLPFADALLRAGIVAQDSPRLTVHVDQVFRVGDDQAWIQAEPSPHGQLELEYRLHYENSPAIREQRYSAAPLPEVFVESIAPARTFLLKQEAEVLRQQGLGQRVTYRDLLVFDGERLLDNSLRYSNECARHKLLDMVGDFALLGADLVGKFTAYRSGHYLNSKMVLALLQRRSLLEPRKSA